jgi:O-antigen/teichoic acid export membrane protein
LGSVLLKNERGVTPLKRISPFYRNSIYNIVGQLGVMLASIVAAKFIFSDLGGNELGVIYFGLFLQLALTELVSLGIVPSIVREIARADDSHNEYIKNLLQCSSFIFWIVYLLICICVYLLLPWIVTSWLNLDGLNQTAAVDALRILIIGSLLSIPSSSFVASLEGIQKMLYPNLVNVGTAILKNVGILLILLDGGSFLSIVWWISLSAIFRALILFSFVTRFFAPSFFIPVFHRYVLEKNWIYGLRMSSVSISAFINTQVERLIITKFLAISVLGYYSLALSVVQGVGIFSGAISRAAYPVFVELFKNDRSNELNSKYDLWQDVICFFSVPLIALIMFFNQTLFRFIFDATVSIQLQTLVHWLSLGIFFQISCFLPHTLAISCGQEKVITYLGWYNVIISFLGAYFGIKYFGLSGAGLGFLAARVFVIWYAIPKIADRILRRNWIDWSIHLLKIILVSFSTFGIFFIISVGANLDFLDILLCYFAGLILYLFGSWFAISQQLRDFLLGIYSGNKVKL